MKLKRPLRHESLESRRLLAAKLDFGGFEPLHRFPWKSADISWESADFKQAKAVLGDSELVRGTKSLDFVDAMLYPGLSYGHDLVQEVGDRLFVVDQGRGPEHGASLLVFERSVEGELDLVQESKLEMHVDEMFVHQEQVVLIGNRFDVRIMAPAGLVTAASKAVSTLFEGASSDRDWKLDQDWMPKPPTVQTIALTISIDSEFEGDVVEQTLPGLSHTIHADGDRLVVISSLHQPSFSPLPRQDRSDFSPEFSGLVTTYQVTPKGLQKTSAAEIPLLGTSVARENDLFVASTKQSDFVDWILPFWGGDKAEEDTSVLPDPEISPPTVVVARYSLADKELADKELADRELTDKELTDDQLHEVASAELGQGVLVHFGVAQDGLTGVAVYKDFDEGTATTTIALLDFAGDGIELVESVGVDGAYGHVISGGSDYIVLGDWKGESLLVIETDLKLDLEAEDRVQAVTLPDGIELDHSAIRMGDRLVLRGQRAAEVDSVEDDLQAEAENFDPALVSRKPQGLAPFSFAPGVQKPTVFLVVSLSEKAVLNEIQVPDELRAVSYESLVLIDKDSQRFGFVAEESRVSSVEGRQRSFGENQWVFGRLGEAGNFQLEGVIPIDGWLEVDVTPERLVVRLADHLKEYDWERPSDPTLIPLPRPLPPLEAVNDQFRRRDHGRDQVFAVLANDLVSRRGARSSVQIVELIGAPEGAEIVRGHAIKIPAAAFQEVDSLQFEYVIRDGVRESQAAVDISVVGLREPEVKELVDAVLLRAAEDYEVSVDELKVLSVERLFDRGLPLELPGGPIDLDWLPSVLVVLEFGQSKALYAADSEGDVSRLVKWESDHLAEFAVSAVDSSGKPMADVREGDELFLQLNAKDFRHRPRGLDSAFFDLAIPTEYFEVTGKVEFGPGFKAEQFDKLKEVAPAAFKNGVIESLGVKSKETGSELIEGEASEWQEMLRIGVRAVATGEVELLPQPAGEGGAAALLRGMDQQLPDNLVRFVETGFEILPALRDKPHDATGDGKLTPLDALVVINFLGDFGSVRLADLPGKLGFDSSQREGEAPASIDAMKRYDTNGNGIITALDALIVINGLTLASVTAEAEADEEFADRALEQFVPIDTIRKVDKI
ncbi:MAG: dockerin type I domain-containing protein [Planctomycetota bacterium]|nr:dockerin type I domain-containing protein [Planctomycetota bacterium]